MVGFESEYRTTTSSLSELSKLVETIKSNQKKLTQQQKTFDETDYATVGDLEKSAITRLRKEPDEEAQQEVTEVEENDDFENLYRGQISKSGVAILPSKRTRKIPEIKSPKAAEPDNTDLQTEQEEP